MKRNKQILTNLISNNYKILYRILSLIFDEFNIKMLIPPYFTKLNKLIAQNGLFFAVAYMKQCRLHITRYMCGQPLFVNSVGVSIDKNGGPKCLLALKPLAESQDGKRLILSLMTFTRCFKVSEITSSLIEKSLASVVKPFGRNKNYIVPVGFIKRFVKDFRLKSIDLSFDKKDVYLSTKASINGPATYTAWDSIMTLDYVQMQNIYDITDESGVNFFNKMYSQAGDLRVNQGKYAKCKAHRVNSSGKLSFIRDPELKVRTIAIFDYASQLYLRKIHDGILQLLKNFKTDRTFTQDPKHDWKSDENSFWSMDLSSATDRFPVNFQKNLLSHIIGRKAAGAGETLLTNRDFYVDEHHSVRYSVGQPMGAYSSWGAFTLSHHLVVQWCAYLEGLYPFNDYIILGDDIVIKNDKVALRYKKVMGRLDVDISDPKSHVSLHSYEFAKRGINFVDGYEYTGVPLVGIFNNIFNPIVVFTILFDYNYIKQNFFCYNRSLISFVSDLYKNLVLSVYKVKQKGKKKTRSLLFRKVKIERFMQRMEVHSFILKHIFGLSAGEEKRRFLCGLIKREDYVIPNEVDLINEIFKFGMLNKISNYNSSLKKLADRLYDDDQFEDKNQYSYQPLFVSIFNGIERIISATKETNPEKMIDCFELVENFSIVDYEKVITKKREKFSRLLSVGQCFLDGVRHISGVEEIYYGSAYQTSTFELEDNGATTRMLVNTMEFNTSKLKPIYNGSGLSPLLEEDEEETGQGLSVEKRGELFWKDS